MSVSSTMDKIKDTTIMRMMRKMAGVIDDQNETVANVQEQLDNFNLDEINARLDSDDTKIAQNTTDIATANTNIAQNTTDIATNKTNIQSLRDANIIITKDITAIKEKNTEQDKSISALDTEIDTVNTTLDNKITTVNDKVPKSYMLYRNGEGKIQLQTESNDGTLTDSNILDMIIPYQYDILSGTTNRSFRLKVSMSNGTTYVTNDFVIPEGGGTDVTVTGITLSKDTSDVNRIHVTINLSDSTTIDSGFISLVDNVSASVADNKLTISVNGVSSVPVAIDVTGQITAGNGITVTDGVIAIDTTVVALKSNLDTLSNKVTENSSAIDALESKYDSMSTQITELSTGVSNAITQAQNAQSTADDANTHANACYDDVSIADNVLTFTTVEGDTKEITLPTRTIPIDLFYVTADMIPSTWFNGINKTSGLDDVSKTVRYNPVMSVYNDTYSAGEGYYIQDTKYNLESSSTKTMMCNTAYTKPDLTDTNLMAFLKSIIVNIVNPSIYKSITIRLYGIYDDNIVGRNSPVAEMSVVYSPSTNTWTTIDDYVYSSKTVTTYKFKIKSVEILRSTN